MSDRSTNGDKFGGATEEDLVDFFSTLKETEGTLEPSPESGGLTQEHVDYLAAHAVDVELARSLGVRSLTGRQDTVGLGEPWDRWSNFPAILFPWVGPGPDGRTEHQVRPDNPNPDSNGKLRKYVFRKGMTPVLWAVRPVENAERILITEGTKQSLSAASHAPPEVAVYGIAGCRSWQHEGVPIPDLGAVEGRDVVVVLDADAATNAEVYAAGMGLAEALASEGAESVKFARLPAQGKAGLDDLLASRPSANRAGYLARLVDRAKSKPADTKPKPRKKSRSAPGDPERVTLVCNRDRLDVINDLTKALIDKWDGRELFNHGGAISRLKGDQMMPVDRGTSRDLIQETAITVDELETAQGTQFNFTWPDFNTMAAALSRAEKFSPLDRVAHAPFVRPDGSIVTDPGYDEATRTMLVPDEEVAGIEVPESPTPEQIARARELVMTEWLGDFPFGSDADRANMLALALTPAIRGMVPRVPLAVVDGLQMGVGKNKIADSVLTIYTGHAAKPMNFVDDREELRKQITSAFRTGAEFFVFDEAHTIDGTALAQALTAETWQDRILGFSTMAEFPNRVTWISLGNQVQVRGDLTRRVYRIHIRPPYANPQDRPESSFRHPGQSGMDLESWVRANRKPLLTALLTLVRAWFAAGKPLPTKGISFGSFESWERIVGGIVQVAGLPGFLDNLKVWRSESDFNSQYWIGHLAWLEGQFGREPFRAAEVKAKALADPAGYLAPPDLDDTGDKKYVKLLGEAYARLRGRRYENRRIERVGQKGHVSMWQVVTEGNPSGGGGSDLPEAPLDQGGPEGTPGDPPSPRHTREHTPLGGDGVGTPGDGSQETSVSVDEGNEGPPRSPRSPRPGVGLTFPINDETRPAAELMFGGALPYPITTELVTFDLETGSAEDLHRYPDPKAYIRISGAAADDEPATIFDGPNQATLTADILRSAREVTGHNIMAFDLPALVRAGSLTMTEVHQMAKDGRLFDGLLAARYLNPPMAKDKGVDATRKYDLDTLGAKFDLGSKTTKAADLAKKHGGYDQIPVDDPEYRQYLAQDVELSRRLFRRLRGEIFQGGPKAWDYLEREHRIAAIAAQISLNGFRVDVSELERRVREIENRKAEAYQFLNAEHGLPLADARGKPYRSPLGTKAGKEALERAFIEAGATSIWKTEKTGQIDISGDHMRYLASENHHLPQVREIAKAVFRIVSARTVYETVSSCLIGDRVHPKIGFEQATGRWSTKSPGLTVMGKRGGRHVEREVFLPEPGEVILAVDLSQVDMRAVAGLSGDQAYIDMLRHDDPHTEIAKALFGDAKFREKAKAIGHGWNYGRGIKAISMSEEIEPKLVQQFDASMRERFPRLVEWQNEVRALAESGELLDNGFGRKMRPDPQRAHTQGPALMGQGAARDIMMEGMLRLADQVPDALLMLRAQIHDEVVLSVPEDRAEEIREAVVEAFTWEWRGVPILADASPMASDWGSVYAK